mmetsp:Transcript_9301/g.56644  ORF Transcript_9301/g.56644 Transcript_9301/m.56644 type:complete len:95 (+) Transcript_9301:3935-4219(+)
MPFEECSEGRSVEASLFWLWQHGSYVPKSLAHEVQSVDTHVSQPLQVLCHELFAILMVVDAFPFVALLDFLAEQLCLETWATPSLSAGDGEKQP